MRHRRLATATVFLAVAVLSGGLAGVPATGAPTSVDCHVDTSTTEEVPQWLSSEDGHRVSAAVAQEVQDRFGPGNGKDDGFASLRSGVIGLTVDHKTREIVLVADRAGAGLDKLAREFGGVAAKARGTGSGPRVRVQAGCNSAASLLAAQQLLAGRAWHPLAARAGYSSYLDPADARFHVSVDSDYPEVAESLRTQLGDRAEVTLGAPRREGRSGDASPHKGGAYIGSYTDDWCTAGFVVIRANGQRAMVTAGHCFTNGDAVYSTGVFYGYADGEYDFPRYDMTLVTSPSERYSNILYVDPCCPDTRAVSGAADPAVNSIVCKSGAYSKTKCGIRILNWTGTLCDASGCTEGLLTGRRDDGSTITMGGDSGAPIYSKPDGTHATIGGLHIGTPGGIENGKTILAERYSSVRIHLNVTVATS
jgi:hypothetical protein